MKQNKANHGFTLIELLIVISIIGLLTSIILASLSQARKKGSEASTAANTQVLSKALEMYYQDHGTYPTGTFSSDQSSWNNQFLNSLRPYLSRLPQGDFTQIGFGYVGPTTNGYMGFLDDPTKCAVTYKGYLIYSYGTSTSLAQNDGGISPGAYEIYGGDSYHGNMQNVNSPNPSQRCY